MGAMLDAFWRAVAYCLHPRVMLWSLVPLFVAGGAVGLLGWLYWEPTVAAVRETLAQWELLAALMRWLDSIGGEAAHALLEHSREQLGKNVATSGVLRLGAALLGLGQVGDMGAQMLAQFASLKFSRDDETQADRLGLLMAAQAGYDPRKGVSLWRKMTSTSRGAPPEMLSTHPAGPTRIRDIEEKLPSVMPVWDSADKPARRFGPPPAAGK